MDYALVVSRAAALSDDEVLRAYNELRGQIADLLPPARLSSNAAEMRFSSETAVNARDLNVSLPVDANIVPIEGREKSVFIADMDSTIINVECIDEIADFAGVKAEVANVTEAAMRGELDFEAALYARVAKIKGVSVQELQQCYEERVRLNAGAKTLVQTMNKRGAKTILASGGFTFFAERVAKAAGFSEFHANVLDVKDNALTGELIGGIVDGDKKAEILQNALDDAGLDASNALAVGDGANDLKMITLAGFGAAYYAKPALDEKADIRLHHSDLTALLAIQGIPEVEWVMD